MFLALSEGQARPAPSRSGDWAGRSGCFPAAPYPVRLRSFQNGRLQPRRAILFQ